MREGLLRMRGAKPFAMTDLRRQPDLAQAIRFIETQGLTRP
jgi:urease accessory protein